MALTLREWLNSEEVKNYQNIEPAKFYEKEFVRNPLRSVIKNENIGKSPADGILLYQGLYDCNSAILEIKGKKYTIKNILMNPKKEGKFYVTGIYLTTYSVHLIRAIASGIIVKILQLPPLISNNISMILFEQGIYQNKIIVDLLEYNFYNERTIIKQYVPKWNTYVYYVLIADQEVNKNLLFVKSGDKINQGERLAYVLFGSQCDILIQKQPWIKISYLLKPGYYVFAGQDDLFTVKNQFFDFKDIEDSWDKDLS